MRLSAAQIARSKVVKTPTNSVVHIDDFGIYTNESPDTLDVYSHCFGHIAHYTFNRHQAALAGGRIGKIRRIDPSATGLQSHSRTLLFVNRTPAGIVCATNSAIYLTDAEEMPCQYSIGGDNIRNFAYHPIRDTLIVACSTHMFELDTDFKRTQRPMWVYPARAKFLPSTYSDNLYMTWQLIASRLAIIPSSEKSRVVEFVLQSDNSCHTLIARQGHPDVLTLIYPTHVDVLDMWHSSSAIPPNTRILAESMCGTHVSPNVCILGDWDKLRIADLRFGLVCTRSVDRIVDLWNANGRTYVNGCAHLYVLD